MGKAALTPENIRATVKEIVVRVLNLEIDPNEIADDELLLGGGLEVDSLAVLQIVDELEVAFDVVAQDEEVTAELFRSVASLSEFVERKRGDSAVTPGTAAFARNAGGPADGGP